LTWNNGAGQDNRLRSSAAETVSPGAGAKAGIGSWPSRGVPSCIVLAGNMPARGPSTKRASSFTKTPALGIDDKARDILVIGREADKAEVVAVWHAPVETSGAELQPGAVPADRRGFEIGEVRRVDLVDEKRAPARGEEPQRGENDERDAAADQEAAHISERR
jgi:hypothetical protein